MFRKASDDSAGEGGLKVETREELVYLLGQACEIEHGLMCEYLYAQFSLKRSLDEGLTPDQLGRVQAWETALISVIKQEMLHPGAEYQRLDCHRRGTAFRAAQLPRSCPAGTRPGVDIGRGAVWRACPASLHLPRAARGNGAGRRGGFAAARHARPLTAGDAALVAVPEEWRTVGHLYRGIEAGLTYLCGRYGEGAVFIGPPEV